MRLIELLFCLTIGFSISTQAQDVANGDDSTDQAAAVSAPTSFMQLQQPLTDALNAEGAACIQGWSAFASDYSGYVSSLSQLGTETQTILTKIATDQENTSTDDDPMTPQGVCSPSGKAMGQKITQRLGVDIQGLQSLSAEAIKINDLWVKAGDRIETQAGQQFHYSFHPSNHCLSKTYYSGIAKMAVGNSQASNSGNGAMNSFQFLSLYISVQTSALLSDYQILTNDNTKLQALLKQCGSLTSGTSN
jgi:hypothetical protein